MKCFRLVQSSMPQLKAVLICSLLFKQNVGQDYLEKGCQHEMAQVGSK